MKTATKVVILGGGIALLSFFLSHHRSPKTSKAKKDDLHRRYEVNLEDDFAADLVLLGEMPRPVTG
ncbi:MAG: hypothetical protein AAB495_04025 [Patescibacteria group bacterium]